MKIGLLDTKEYEKLSSKFINGEVELGVIRRHYMFIIKGILIELFFALVGILALWGINALLITISSGYGWISYVLISILFLAIIFRFIVLWIDYKYDFLVGTNFRIFVIDNNFIFYSDYRPINFEQIEEVKFTQDGIIQTIFRYGIVEMSIKGRGDENMIKYNFAPREAADVINKISSAHAKVWQGLSGINSGKAEQFHRHDQAVIGKVNFIKRSNPVKKIDDDISDKIADVFDR